MMIMMRIGAIAFGAHGYWEAKKDAGFEEARHLKRSGISQNTKQTKKEQIDCI